MISFRIGILATCVSVTACLDTGPRGITLGELESLNPPLGEGSLWPGLSTQWDKVVLSWQENDGGNDWSVKTAIIDEAGWGSRTYRRPLDGEERIFHQLGGLRFGRNPRAGSAGRSLARSWPGRGIRLWYSGRPVDGWRSNMDRTVDASYG